MDDEQLDQLIVEASAGRPVDAEALVHLVAEVRRLREFARDTLLRTSHEAYGRLQHLHTVDPAGAEAIADAYMGVRLPPDVTIERGGGDE